MSQLSFHLLDDPWLPVRRSSGAETWITPADITSNPGNDPVVALASPRPDFDGALLQFLIALLQSTCAPTSSQEWLKRFVDPPSPGELRELFAVDESAFAFAGEKLPSRFLQDVELAFDPDDAVPIAGLLIDSPGAKTLKDNADHFVKRDRVNGLCAACTATALFTLQTNAPSGGVGHRTSLRGGGPLTTLLTLDPATTLPNTQRPTLWHDLWLNVLPLAPRDAGRRTSKTKRADIYPWLAPTRTSDKSGVLTTPDDVHALQMYWNMPRRIVFDPETTPGDCDLCGRKDELYTRYATKNYGTNYSEGFRHPLSPHYKDEKTGATSPLHPQPGGMTYRYWLRLMLPTKEANNLPAHVVTAFEGRRQDGDLEDIDDLDYLLYAFGYDMDNMKARAYYEARMPVLFVSKDVREVFARLVADMLNGANQFAGNTRNAVKQAWFRRPQDVRGNADFIRDEFIQATETGFYDHLHRLKQQGEDGRTVLTEWHAHLHRASLATFHKYAPPPQARSRHMQRYVEAIRFLLMCNYSKKLKNLLNVPEKKFVPPEDAIEGIAREDALHA